MYILLEKGHTVSADDVQGNFNHVGQGDLIPRGGNLLEPTTGVYDLGSNAYRWDQGYVNTVNLGSGTVQRCMNMIAEVTLTATASSIEFTGLNGEVDVVYEINCDIVGYATAYAWCFFNGDSTTNNYGYQYVDAENTVVTSGRDTSGSGFFLGLHLFDTTTAKYIKSNILLYSNNIIKPFLIKINGNCGSSYIRTYRQLGYVWNNSATLTSMKFIGSFDVGTHIEIWAKR